MSGKRPLHLESTPTQEPERDEQVAPRARQFYVGQPIPYVLTKRELADFLGLSVWVLDRFRANGSHPAIKELLPRVGHPRFQGAAVKAWLAQDAGTERHFFGSVNRQKRNR